MTGGIALLAAVTAERLGELWLARRNTNALFDKGAFEVAAGHYPLIVCLHALWLSSLWILGWNADLQPLWVGVFLLLQVFRAWVLFTLGQRWTTRIIVVENMPLQRSGPYRVFRHPNYMVVVGEIAVLPLCFGLPTCAIIFSIANAVVLAIRIHAENAALANLRASVE